MNRFNWNLVVSTIASGLAIMAFGGWLSTRDAARDAYSMANESRGRIAALEEGRLADMAIPGIQEDVAELRSTQRWMVGVIYDLARAINPKLPIDPPPSSGP